MNDYEERKQARIQRLKDRAERAWQSYLKDVYYKLGKLGLREEEQCK